jgi:hypothetical protein
MAIEVGDAIYRFLGNTQNIDEAFKHIDDGVAKLPPVPDEVPESIKLTGDQLREARGEARLLGEEFGIRLPRHVSNFLAAMPGVGQALSAAFSATAVMFLANALVDVTKKATNFVADNLIFTQSMKDSNAATVETNKILLELAENYDKAKEGIEKFGATGTDTMRLQLQANKEQLATLNQNLAASEKVNQTNRGLTHQYLKQNGFLKISYDWLHSIVTGTKTQKEMIDGVVLEGQTDLEVNAAKVKALNEQNELLEKQLNMQHAIEAIHQGGETKSAAARLAAERKQVEVAEDQNTSKERKAIAEELENTLYTIKRDGMLKQLALLKENDANTKDEQVKLLAQMKAAADDQAKVVLERLVQSKDELQKALEDIAKTVRTEVVPDIEIITPPWLVNMMKGINAAKDMGVTLRQDLVAAFVAAKKAQDDFMASGIKDGVAQAALANNILKAKAALDAYGQDEDKFKIRSHGIFAQLEADSKTGAAAMNQWKQVGANALSEVATSAQSALTQLILAQGSFGEAMLKATESVLASVASQAAIQGLFDVAKAYEASASFDYGAAAQYTAAAETMFIVAALAGGSAAALARTTGGGGGSSNTQQGHTSQSNTGSSNGGSNNTVGIQHFATGGLITAPTLAMIGEQNRAEAVLPLEDPRAMTAIGEALGGAGGGNIHVHVAGLISPDNLTKVVDKINKRVNRGQLHLQSSNTLRITKRSA